MAGSVGDGVREETGEGEAATVGWGEVGASTEEDGTNTRGVEEIGEAEEIEVDEGEGTSILAETKK